MPSSLAVTAPPVEPFPPAPSTAAAIWSLPMASHHMDALVRLWHGCLAVVMALFAQLLIAGIQRPLAEKNVDFPPAILAMAVVYLCFQLCGCFIPGIDSFYQQHLKPAANLLNRHMSIGFTVPFVMVCRNSLASPETIGLITACFVLTGVVNTLVSYTIALPLQTLLSCCARLPDPAGCAEAKDLGDKCLKEPKEPLGEDSSTMYRSSGDESGPETSRSPTPLPSRLLQAEPRTSSIFIWVLRNPMLLLSWTLTLLAGVPIRYTTGNPTVLTTTFLFAIWFTTLALQSSIKTTSRLPSWLRTLLSGLINPVLWTSVSLIAYAFTESAFTSAPFPIVLDTLQSRTTLSDLVIDSSLPVPAAGDFALSLLNAGLVAWGLKLYEYRAQLLSRAGLTVFSVSSLVALTNVALGPVLAKALGLAPATRDLAFAARSVTLALGSPVMGMLGGDAGLNAVMVVASGIIFQMGLGLGVGRWMAGALSRIRGHHHTSHGAGGDVEAQTQLDAQGMPRSNEAETVAAGVTVGINAAAMGTAYLYEAGSVAAPYSALSMMALGIMTVVFASIQPLANWVVNQVALST